MKLFTSTKKKPSLPPLPLLNAESSRTRYAEAYRTLRTNVHFSAVDEDVRSLIVTSAGAGEGKTNTAANLAYTMAQAGKKVLMVDCDLRRPTLSKIADTGSSVGITGLLVKTFNKPLHELAALEHSLFDFMCLVGLQKKSGCLRARDENDQVELYFINGRLEDLNWSTRPAEKRFTAVLVANGLLTVDQADMVLRRQKDTGNRLGSIISRMGFLAEGELKGLLNMHVMETLYKVVEMHNPTLAFTDLSEGRINNSTVELLDLEELLHQAMSGREKLPLMDSFIREAVKKIDENLFLLPTGTIPPNPLELLASQKMQFLFDRLQDMYDVLVIDTPPILPASDALMLAPKTDGVLLVIKAGFLNRDMVGRAIEQLRGAKANILGCVLNQVDTRREGYYKYYYKYYSKYYGDDAST